MKARVSLDTGAAANPILRQVAIHSFEVAGRAFMDALGLQHAFEITTRSSWYPDVRQSWEVACVEDYARLFEGRITKDSTAREFRTELCIRRFATGEVSGAIAEFDRSIPDSEIIKFLSQEAAAYRRGPGRPLKEQSLRTVMLEMWLHSLLWLLSNEDRAWLINRIFGSRLQASADGVKKAIRRLGLKGWSSFPSGGLTHPPGRIILDPNGKFSFSWRQQEECQKSDSPSGQNSKIVIMSR